MKEPKTWLKQLDSVSHGYFISGLTAVVLLTLFVIVTLIMF